MSANSITAPAPDPYRPPLKWAGGKRWLVPKLERLWRKHRHRRLVEPFCGGLAVALGLKPATALLGDINPHTVNFYRQLQSGLTVDIPMQNDRALYLAHREEFNRVSRGPHANSRKAAALFYFLNRTGFNGLCRFNKSGEFNVPFGRHKTIRYMSDFTHYQPVLSDWEFVCGDFAGLDVAAGDFIYADPPYDVQFTSYAAGGFGWPEQERLAAWLSQHDGPIVASNQATDRVLALYRKHGFKIRKLPAPRAISRTGDRTPATEMLATRGL